MRIQMPRDAGEARKVRVEAQELADAGQQITLIHPKRFPGDIAVCEDLKRKEPQMDFKVGDVVRLESGSVLAFFTSELELLPTEPSQQPMTATQASIASEQERYLARRLIEECRLGLYGEALGAAINPGSIESHHHKVPTDGWMPAGTYMPLGNQSPPETEKAPRRHLRYQQQRNGIFLQPDTRDGRISTLKETIKPRFPERTRLTTRSWDPGYNDLEDA